MRRRSEKHQLIDDFVLREFLRDVADGQEHLYKLSIAIAEVLLTFENDLADLKRDLRRNSRSGVSEHSFGKN